MKTKSLNIAIIFGRAILRVFALICVSMLVIFIPTKASAAGGTLTVSGAFEKAWFDPSATGSVSCSPLTTSLVKCHYMATYYHNVTWGAGASAKLTFSVTGGTSPYNYYFNIFGSAPGATVSIANGGSADNPFTHGQTTIINGSASVTNWPFITTTASGTGTHTVDMMIYISTTALYTPPPDNCAATFKDNEVVVDNLDIYPPVEWPQGPDAELPALPDYQKVTLPNMGTAQIFHLSTAGSWNNGTVEKTDFSYSFDGTTYLPLIQLVEILCIDDTGYYFRTSQTMFFIRVNDLAGAFVDNTPSAAPFPTYSISIALQVAPLTCTDQFTSDAVSIDLGLINSQSAIPKVPAATFVVGDWYEIVTSGTPSWKNVSNVEQFTIKVGLTAESSAASEFSVWQYTSCSELTGTGQHKRYFFQAPTSGFYLWVNSEDFAHNTGLIGYEIFHATQTTYWPADCERIFQVNDKKFTQTYDASAPGGNVVPPTNWQFWTTGQLDPVINGNNGAFILGQWYMMETKGLWKNSAGQYSGASDWSDDSKATWADLQSWSEAECVVPIDKMGHYRVYWQFPDGKVQQTPSGYYIRVNGVEGVFGTNTGNMSVDVYEVTNGQVLGIGTIPVEGACDGTYIVDDHIIDALVEPVRAQGIYIPTITPGTLYAIETKGFWKNDGSGGELTTADISDDNGVTWYAWNEYPGARCFEAFVVDDKAQLRMYFKAEAGRSYKVRASDTSGWTQNTSGTHPNEFGIKLYAAQAIIDPWNSCTQNYSLSVIKSGEVLYSHLGGATPSDASRLDLIPGELYSIEITSGEWFDDPDAIPKYDFQLSFDDGSTWYTWNDRIMPGFQCSATGPQYGRVYFMAANANTYSRIRVRDRDDPNDFGDNTGQLMYTIYASSTGGDPDITAYVPPSAVVACYTFPTRPSSALDIGAWIEYSRGSIQRFFLWCPEHTAALEAIVTDARQLEPLKTITRISNLGKDVNVQLASYDWQGGAPDMPFTGEGGGTDVQSLIPNFSNSPFNGAPLEWSDVPTIPFGGEGGGESMSSITSCSAHVVLTMGESPLVVGFCTIMNALKLTGANVIVNICIVFASIFLFIRYLIKKWIGPLIQIITHSGAKL